MEVCLATMGAPLSAHQEREARALGNVQIHESRFKLEWMEEPWDDVGAAGEWLLDLEQRLQPEIVHGHRFLGLLGASNGCWAARVVCWRRAWRPRPARWSMEALASGMPVIAFASGALAEIVEGPHRFPRKKRRENG